MLYLLLAPSGQNSYGSVMGRAESVEFAPAYLRDDGKRLAAMSATLPGASKRQFKNICASFARTNVAPIVWLLVLTDNKRSSDSPRSS